MTPDTNDIVYSIQKSTLLDIADAVRAKTGKTDAMSLSDLTDAIGSIDADGGYDDGFEAGKKSEYDTFWDALQDYGNKVAYLSEFQSPTWTNENFKPKYKIFATNGTFSNGEDSTHYKCNITDLRPETIGVEIDWSKCTNFNYILRKTPIAYVGVVDMSNAQYGWCLFGDMKALKSVEKVILPPESANIAFKHLGFNRTTLESISFEGEFYGSVDFYDCKLLNKESIISAINALSLSTVDTAISFSLKAVNNAFETSVGAADGSTSEEWLTLVATKQNWTISLT